MAYVVNADSGRHVPGCLQSRNSSSIASRQDLTKSQQVTRIVAIVFAVLLAVAAIAFAAPAVILATPLFLVGALACALIAIGLVSTLTCCCRRVSPHHQVRLLHQPYQRNYYDDPYRGATVIRDNRSHVAVVAPGSGSALILGGPARMQERPLVTRAGQQIPGTR